MTDYTNLDNEPPKVKRPTTWPRIEINAWLNDNFELGDNQ